MVLVLRPLARAEFRLAKTTDESRLMTAITTKSSIKVKPRRFIALNYNLFFFERHPQQFKESNTFFFIFSSRNKSDRHAENISDILIRSFRKDGVLFYADS